MRTLRQAVAAVAAVSPILGDIRVDIPISNIGVGLLGTLPPILFAASGFIAPRVARGIGLDGGIVLINSRTRSHGGTVALSGFAQGVAYALGPLLVGLLHDVTSGWTLPLLFLMAVALVATIPAITLARPAFVEDELSAAAQQAHQTAAN